MVLVRTDDVYLSVKGSVVLKFHPVAACTLPRRYSRIIRMKDGVLLEHWDVEGTIAALFCAFESFTVSPAEIMENVVIVLELCAVPW
jgi:hypothetical protein